MTTQCLHCRSLKSRVIETRHARIREFSPKGKRTRCQTVIRRRVCLSCDYRWNTVEMLIRNPRPTRDDRGLLYVRRKAAAP